MSVILLQGDALEEVKKLQNESIDCCITSPPYFGLRNYGVQGQIGLEDSPETYIQNLVAVFREVKRVLKNDGTLWVNIGDSYATGTTAGRKQSKNPGVGANRPEAQNSVRRIGNPKGCKTKDLVGIPWLLAFALRADGWYLRQDIIWFKPNAMPESVKDRCTKSHEYLFLLSKSEKYYYNADAIKELSTSKATGKRNRRDVWAVNTSRFQGAHFATFPTELIRPCVLAGSKDGGTILDPFGGSGTTAIVAVEEHRRAIIVELNAEYISIAQKRIHDHFKKKGGEVE